MFVCDRPAVTRWVVLAVLALIGLSTAQAQQLVTTGQSVGGVSIDAQGQLSNVSVAGAGAFEKLRLEAIPDGLRRPSELRKVSLKGLDAQIEKCLADHTPLPIEVQCLGGLQDIRYVLVYPEQQDIVLVGFGEGWKQDKRGNLVGATTGRPVLLLDDLVTALRVMSGNVRGPMQCSIDPTAEGLQRLAAFAKQQRTIGSDPGAMAGSVEQTLGPQKITVAGVPATSHFAVVMVAADYRMKRISMGLEPSPVAGLPSFMEYTRAGATGMGNMLPRWWLEPNYDSLRRDEQGLSWEIRGGSVKAMCENDYFDAQQIQHTGKADAASQRWAEAMTARYPDLAKVEPVFGQLRNCMDLAVVAALLVKENLPEKAGARFVHLTGESTPTAELNAPKQLASQATLAKKGKKWLIAAGGVSINPWTIVAKTETNPAPAAVRTKSAAPAGAAWYWD